MLAHGADRIVLGKRLANVEPLSGGAAAVIIDGTRVSGDVLIGADGARSSVRRAIFNEGPPAFTDKIVYRFMLPAEDAAPSLTSVGRLACSSGRGRCSTAIWCPTDGC